MKIASPLISVSEFITLQNSTDLILIDASNSKTAFSDNQKEHLKGARFVDLNNELSDTSVDPKFGGRHPLPKLKDFSKTLGELGITPDSHVVVYDSNFGANAAARFWWMLKSVGHTKIQVLNGGLQAALKFKLTSESTSSKWTQSPIYPVNSWLLPTTKMTQIQEAAAKSPFLIIDVREPARYNGEFEPIDLIAGHIPGAINVPFNENLDDNGSFLPIYQLYEKYDKVFQGKEMKNIIVHCGSGVTACHSILAICHAGFDVPNLYVGSWSEWSRNAI